MRNICGFQISCNVESDMEKVIDALGSTLDCIGENLSHIKADNLYPLLRQANEDFEKIGALLTSNKMAT